MVRSRNYPRHWYTLAYFLLGVESSQSTQLLGLSDDRKPGSEMSPEPQGRARYFRSEPVDEVIVDSDRAPSGDQIFYGAPGKEAYLDDNSSVDITGAAYSVSHPDLASTSRLVEEITKIEFVTDHKFRVPTATGYLRISMDVDDHLSLVYKRWLEMNQSQVTDVEIILT